MKDFNYYLKTIGEYGEVVELLPALASVAGLPNARPFEIVIFESGAMGQIFSIGKNHIEIVLFSKTPVIVGERVTRTNEILSIEIGNHLLGSVISPLGESIFGTIEKASKTEIRSIENQPEGIINRASIKKPLHSGITLVDLLLPLGKGQKQLVIGDRKTGKTSFLLTTVKKQIEEGSLVVYGAIARKQSDILKLLDFFKKHKLDKSIVTVLTTSHDSPALIYLTPFTAMTIAEYFKDQGRDVLVVLDDLSSHAKFYREMSLVGRRFPGRESYPGDIFYTHSRLMERAGNFKVGPQLTIDSSPKNYTPVTVINEKITVDLEPKNVNGEPLSNKEVSISCLPVVETVESDLTGYISTNIMSMTDGHIFFDQGTFAQGRRPAVNIPLSVTRVGRQAQSPLKRDINQKLTSFLSQFDQMQNLSHFGAELSGKVQNVLKTGEKLFSLFKQANHETLHENAQLILFALIWSNTVDEKDITKARDAIISATADDKNNAFFESLIAADTLDQFLVQINQHKEELMTMLGINATPEPQISSQPVPPIQSQQPQATEPTQTKQQPDQQPQAQTENNQPDNTVKS